MRLKITRFHIQIIPEGETDEAYIEEVLGLEREGSWCKLVRQNVIGMNALALLETREKGEK